MTPGTRVRIRDSILEVEVETTEDLPIDDVITKAEALLARVKGVTPEDNEA